MAHMRKKAGMMSGLKIQSKRRVNRKVISTATIISKCSPSMTIVGRYRLRYGDNGIIVSRLSKLSKKRWNVVYLLSSIAIMVCNNAKLCQKAVQKIKRRPVKVVFLLKKIYLRY